MCNVTATEKERTRDGERMRSRGLRGKCTNTHRMTDVCIHQTQESGSGGWCLVNGEPIRDSDLFRRLAGEDMQAACIMGMVSVWGSVPTSGQQSGHDENAWKEEQLV